MTSTIEKINRISTDSDVLHSITHGPSSGPDSVVMTEGGPVKTLARIVFEVPSAESDRELAVTAAATSAASALVASSSASAAAAARDAATIGSGVYPDEPTGRAAVADGQYFKVQGDGTNVAAYEYRRVSASVASTLVASYPAAATVAGNRLTTGELFSSLKMFSSLANGATSLSDSLGRIIGFSIPAASTGATSVVAGSTSLTAADLASLTGQTLCFVSVYSATANFLTDKPLNANAVRVTLQSGSATNRGSVVSTTQNGTTIIRTCSYVVQGDEAAVGTVLQLASTAVANNAHTVQLQSQVFYVQAPSGTQVAGTFADKMADWRLRHLGDTFPTLRFSYSKTDFTTSVQKFNGAIARNDSSGAAWGWTIPAGQTGTNTLVQMIWKVPSGDAANLAGRTLRYTIGCDTSASYSRNVTVAGQTALAAGGTRSVAPTVSSNAQISSTRRQIVFTLTLTGDESAVQPYIQSSSSTTTAGDEWLLVTDIVVEVFATPSDTLKTVDENARLFRDMLMQTTADQIAMAINAAASSPYAKTLKVKADGTGDFTTLKDAAASITDASAGKRYEIQLFDAHTVITDITQANWKLPSYVDVRYLGRGFGWLEYHFPATIAPTDTPNASGFYVNGTSKLTGLKVTVQNGRYPIHSDAGGANPNTTIQVFDCWFEHYGNQDAVDYQTSLGAGGNPAGIWSSWSPFGHGTASGQLVEFHRTTFASIDRGAYVHTNLAFGAPAICRYHQCRMITRNLNGSAVMIQPLGSGQRDVVDLIGCQMQGDVNVVTGPWEPTDTYQPSDRSEIAITLSGCSPVSFNYQDNALALSVVSADTTTAASVVVSGDAASVLFGTPVSLGGGGGLPAQVYGSIDVSGNGVGASSNVYMTSMGYRLGDCSTTAKTLLLTFNGGQVATVTFNQNYTSVSNATILAAINSAIQTAFGNSALSLASLISVFATVRPHVLDHEVYLQNTSSVGLARGSVVRADLSDLAMAPMASTDMASAMVGVTLERVLPGAWGRVRKAKGQVFRIAAELNRSDSAPLVKGDTMGIGSSPGVLVKGAATPLLVAINPNKVTSI
ncbi:hypothetical protein K6W76_09730 [Burkholderia anthina]|uniref:hypothetical protein n=1 Tax=Burkholderia anthina TaxID=179879 RepID=UPI00158D7C7B|nr:hypothetical protein [Burkholderia anthina]MBY4866787.1 hypothetical protein [Burkholderia anthina]